MRLHSQPVTLFKGIIALLLMHGISAGQDSGTPGTMTSGLDIGLISLSEISTLIPHSPSRNLSYDPLQPAESGHLVLYVANNTDASRSVDTSTVRIRAIGSERHELELGGDLFGDAKEIEVPAGESKIVFRKPWKSVLDADTLRRDQERDLKNSGLLGVSDAWKMSASFWWWRARPKGPDSPIYQIRGDLAAAATIWAEFADEGRTVRSQPLLLLVNKPPR